MASNISIHTFGKILLFHPGTWRLIRLYLGGTTWSESSGWRLFGPVLWKRTSLHPERKKTLRRSIETAALRVLEAMATAGSFGEEMNKGNAVLCQSALFPEKEAIREAIRTVLHSRHHPEIQAKILEEKKRGRDYLCRMKQLYALTAFILERKEARLLQPPFSGKDRRFLAGLSSAPALTKRENQKRKNLLHRLEIHRRMQPSEQVEALQVRTEREYRELFRQADRFY